jgi:plastocyanin
MSKKILLVFTVLTLLSVMVVACGGRNDTSNSTTGSNTSSANSSGYDSTNSSGYGSTKNAAAATTGSNEVHLSTTSFAQPSITIAKGSKLTIIDDTSVVHQIENGSWVNDTPKPLKENNAPTVSVMFKGNDTQTVGPFAVAGTYHLFCTIHDNMNLTVIVK